MVKKTLCQLVNDYVKHECSCKRWDIIINQWTNREITDEVIELFVSLCETWIFKNGKVYNFKTNEEVDINDFKQSER